MRRSIFPGQKCVSAKVTHPVQLGLLCSVLARLGYKRKLGRIRSLRFAVYHILWQVMHRTVSLQDVGSISAYDRRISMATKSRNTRVYISVHSKCSGVPHIGVPHNYIRLAPRGRGRLRTLHSESEHRATRRSRGYPASAPASITRTFRQPAVTA